MNCSRFDRAGHRSDGHAVLLHMVGDFPIMLEMARLIDYEKYRKGLFQ